MSELLPCPFCGNETPEFERVGSPRQSCIVSCGSCGARHESSDEGSRNGSSWNQRAAAQEAQPEAVGWKRVPVEPTPAMLVAMWDHRESMRGQSENRIARAGYAAMLAAVPPTTEPDCAGGSPCTTCPDKRKCQRGCLRQVEASESPNRKDLRAECDAVDALLRSLGLDPERCRTEGGALNVSRTLSLLKDARPLTASPTDPTDPLEKLTRISEELGLYDDLDTPTAVEPVRNCRQCGGPDDVICGGQCRASKGTPL